MNNAEITRHIPAPPPKASELPHHEPMRGMKGRIARAYTLDSVRVTVSLLAVAGTVTAVGFYSEPGAAISRAAVEAYRLTVGDEPLVDEPTHTAKVTAPQVAPLDGAPEATADANPAEEVAEAAIASVVEAPHEEVAADPVVEKDELAGLEMKDLVAAVDNLGFRVMEAEKKLQATQAEETTTVKEEKAADDGSVTTEVREEPVTSKMSPEDKALYQRLSERLAEAKKAKDAKAIGMAESELAMFEATLGTLIEFRIVDREEARAGFWRSSADAPSEKQFYLVVEAVVDGKPVNWAIKDADSGDVVSAAAFGLRVDEQTFSEFASDKAEDGKIDDAVVGIKPVGRISPVWSVKTAGQTIAGVAP